MVEKSTAPKAEPGLDDVREDLERLRAEFTRLLEAAGKGATAAAAEAAGTAESVAANAGQWAEGRCDSLRQSIRAQPLAACALAAGVGLLLGQILLRR
ncbi:hypothetical protein V5F53_19070 [Xanthobacter sp. V4C-4]|uniref:hypothetical protein n=1 Tax=Xanthobacter cornucopiae TaxID=3119924 RepID=UPI0037266E80